MEDSHGQIVRKRSMCPSISGLETSLKKASSTNAVLTERLFLRWDHPEVLARGVAPRPSLHLQRATSDGAGPRCLQQLSLDGVTLLVESSASNLDRVNSSRPPSRTAHLSGADPTQTSIVPV